MRYSSLIFICFFSLLICDGVRVAINEKFIDAVLKNFLPEIKKFTQGTELPDSGCLDRLKFSIPNFDLSKIKLTFTDKGLLNLQINGLSPELSGRATKKIAFVRVRKSFTVTLKNFRFNGNLKITSKNDKGVLVPDIYFDGDPSMNFSPKISLGGGIINKILSFLINGVSSLAKGFIMPAIKKQLKKILENVVTKLPKEIPINNYKLDVTLSSNTEMRNKFLEINSNARLYNPNIPTTKTKYFPKVTFPRLTTMGSQLQLYISEFSVNAAIYTILASNNQEIKKKIKASQISKMLPGVNDKYGNETYIVFTGTPDISLQISEENLNVNLPGTFSIRSISGEDIIKLDLRLALKVDASIQGGKVTGTVKDLDLNLGKININKLSVDLSVVNKGFSEVKPILIGLLNEFITSKMQLTFPTVMGIQFTQLSLEHKNHYLLINFNLVRK